MNHLRSVLLVSAVFVFCAMCKKDPQILPYKTKHVVIVVVDGARYQETWGNGELTYIPHRAQMSLDGSVLTNFHNNGYTYTNAGHAAITTGYDQVINNTGNELPDYPSFFQYWRKATGAPAEKAWIITTKDKLNVLSDCEDSLWTGQYRPMYDCGVNGPYTGYREDSVTFNHAINIFQTWHPDLVLINFKEPDASGHANNWTGYLNGIVATDDYIGRLWDFLQADPYYAGTTTLFVTNDHGRHNDNVQDGFVSHGDNCDGCRHIELFAIGPDIKQNFTSDEGYELADLPKTVSQIMLFPMSSGSGRVMQKILK
ncbi:MAG TPA: alkaline phosphatase family protein [Bacteroidia bacterium]|nr:alkaline phosphatase family protein [Bacteroidia bacterium]